MITFFSRTVTSRIRPGQRITVEVDGMAEYQVHVQRRADGLAATMTADKDYPARVAFTLLAQLLDKFAAEVPGWAAETRTEATVWPHLTETITTCQDPSNFDKIIKIQNDLDATTNVLHKTIDSLLERGEKLDNLVERSDDLSKQSKIFYKQARKTNSCPCVIC